MASLRGGHFFYFLAETVSVELLYKVRRKSVLSTFLSTLQRQSSDCFADRMAKFQNNGLPALRATIKTDHAV